MIQHTIDPLPNGNFLLKLLSSEPDWQTVQTTEIGKETAYELADMINANRPVGHVSAARCCLCGESWAPANLPHACPGRK